MGGRACRGFMQGAKEPPQVSRGVILLYVGAAVFDFREPYKYSNAALFSRFVAEGVTSAEFRAECVEMP